MFGNRRRKVNADQAPRDQFGRKVFHGAFKGGFTAGNQNTVADEEGFVSRPYFSSKDRKAEKIPEKKPEDFMDDEDFDDFGRSQVSVAEKKSYVGPNGLFTNFSEEEVRLLECFGYGVADLYGAQPIQNFSHQLCPTDTSTDGSDWITIDPVVFKERPFTPAPSTFNPSERAHLPILDSAPGLEEPQLEEFNFQAMFHVEGERDKAQEVYGQLDKRVTVRWEPAKLLRQRFNMGVSGKAAEPRDPTHYKRRDD